MGLDRVYWSLSKPHPDVMRGCDLDVTVSQMRLSCRVHLGC